LDRHAGSVTAVATTVLVGITVLYVMVTYSLVREQRHQRSLPSVAFELGNAKASGIDLVVRNLGNGRAADLALDAGPGASLPPGISMDSLGPGFNLAPSEKKTWTVNWQGNPPDADVPLTLSYLDSERENAWFNCLFIRLQNGTAYVSASLDESITGRRLKALGRRSLPLSKRVGFAWSKRKLELGSGLVDPTMRRAWSVHLKRELEKTMEFEQNFEASRGLI
jgi:hypothetical protein